MSININQLVSDFRSFLITSWPSLPNWIHDPSDGNAPLNDWLQANWETLVEYRLGPTIRLETYGEGADCNGSSSRITFPNALPTHGIFFSDDYLIDSFGLVRDGFFEQSPPFDTVRGMLDNGNSELLLPFEKADFYLAKLAG